MSDVEPIRTCGADAVAETDADAFYEAGARAKLVRIEKGLAFDPAPFAEQRISPNRVS